MFKKKTVKIGANKIDKIITWVIVGTAVASMVWFSKTKKWKTITRNVYQKSSNIFKKSWHIFKKSYSFFWKAMVWTINFFKKK